MRPALRAPLVILLVGLVSPALAKPDLVGSVKATVNGSSVTLELTVTNAGNTFAPFVSSAYFFQLDHTPGAGDKADEFIDVTEGLQPGEKVVEIRTWDQAPAGEHTAWWVVDAVMFVDESDETNNTSKTSYMIATPPQKEADLVVESMTVTLGTKLQIDASIRNAGDAPTPAATFADLFVDRDTAPGVKDAPDAFADVPVLQPGATLPVQIQVDLPAPGARQAWLRLDPYNSVPESDEGNNVFGPVSYLVEGDPTAPDLVARTLTLVPLPEGRVRIDLTVENAGKRPSGSFHWQIFKTAPGEELQPGAEPEATIQMASLAAGAEVLLSETIHLFPGTWAIWVQVDALDAVLEQNEDNNRAGPATITLGFGDADLVITDFLADPLPTQDVRYRVTVENQGNEASGAFFVDVVLDYPTQPSADLSPFPAAVSAQDNIGLLPAESRTYELTWELAPPGSYTSWAVVDVDDLVGETDDTNNGAGPVEVTVEEVPDAADLQIERFRARVRGNRVTYEVFLKNAGSRQAPAFAVGLFRDRKEGEDPQYGDPPDNRIEMESLGAGESTVRGFIWEPAPDGSFRSWIIIDVDNVVAEASEVNNRAGPRLIVVDSKASACSVGASIGAPCICAGETVFQGYCCAGGWSVNPCVALPADAAGSGDLAGSADVQGRPPARAQLPGSGGCSLVW